MLTPHKVALKIDIFNKDLTKLLIIITSEVIVNVHFYYKEGCEQDVMDCMYFHTHFNIYLETD